ncbi:hypothetical protein CJD36_011200 [Flavipsychrobacter stenotrophus]|uniref:DUF5723 domain-containing protein n=1 Tax=Flavipsychrobacter stenotrophus TaxID=2077091 RepID=A0A2S7SUW7_9BACT|nr:DUF5723 family protein [Flavipsychrobacter stenotrophus]PQJ10534.1 hypothetical protein CJD36_011200 [Flavipsychrobacter stenotrophus]
MKKILLSVSILSIAVTAHGQRFLGVSSGNYNTINSMYLNPANLGGCSEKLSVNLFSANIGIDNNLGTISSVGDIGKTTGNDSGGTNIFKINSGTGKFSMMVPSVELRGPSVLYRINSTHTVAFTTRVRAFNEFNNFDRALYTSVNNPSSVNTTAVAFNAQNFNWTAHVWSEYGLSYGAAVLTTGPIQLKVGATVRYLAGIGYLGIKGKNLDVSYTSGSDSFRASNTDIQYASNIQSLSEGFNNGVSASKIFGGPSGGSGFGADLGAVVSYKTGKEAADYTILLSAAITDIGAITYKTSSFVNVSGNGYIKGSELSENVKNYQDLRNYAGTKGFYVDTGTQSTKVYLPTAMVISADMHLYKKFYASGTLIANMAKDANFGSKYYSQFSIIPRFDTRLISVGLPITYNTLSKTMRFGLGLRFAGFFIGSDDMMATFSGTQYGYNFYAGGMIPIYRKHKS